MKFQACPWQALIVQYVYLKILDNITSDNTLQGFEGREEREFEEELGEAMKQEEKTMQTARRTIWE